MKEWLIGDLSTLGPAARKANAAHALHQISEACAVIEKHLIYNPPTHEVLALLEATKKKIVNANPNSTS